MVVASSLQCKRKEEKKKVIERKEKESSNGKENQARTGQTSPLYLPPTRQTIYTSIRQGRTAHTTTKGKPLPLTSITAAPCPAPPSQTNSAPPAAARAMREGENKGWGRPGGRKETQAHRHAHRHGRADTETIGEGAPKREAGRQPRRRRARTRVPRRTCARERQPRARTAQTRPQAGQNGTQEEVEEKKKGGRRWGDGRGAAGRRFEKRAAQASIAGAAGLLLQVLRDYTHACACAALRRCICTIRGRGLDRQPRCGCVRECYWVSVEERLEETLIT